MDFRSVMPTNLYGEGDNFNLENSHVIPAVMRKIHLAKCLEQNDWQAIRDDINKNPIKGITEGSNNEQIIESLAQQGIKITDDSRLTTNDSQLNEVEVELWGTGEAMREFLYVDDMAQASLFVLELDVKTYKANTKPMLSHINVGTGKDVTIREMAEIMKKVVGFKGNLIFDTTRPDGAPRKLIDVSRLTKMGWNPRIDLLEGLKSTYAWFVESLSVRY